MSCYYSRDEKGAGGRTIWGDHGVIEAALAGEMMRARLARALRAAVAARQARACVMPGEAHVRRCRRASAPLTEIGRCLQRPYRSSSSSFCASVRRAARGAVV
ncbi:hypothetical protein MRX96_016871 [Rhipicephalus microplus]